MVRPTLGCVPDQGFICGFERVSIDPGGAEPSRWNSPDLARGDPRKQFVRGAGNDGSGGAPRPSASRCLLTRRRPHWRQRRTPYAPRPRAELPLAICYGYFLEETVPSIQVTSNGIPVPAVKVDLAKPSSLLQYLKTQLLHLAVLPDFLAVKDTAIGQVAAANPIEFSGSVSHGFQLGNTKPEIEVTPGAHAAIRLNVAAGADLFDDDPFRNPAKIPVQTGYLSVSFEGSLALGVGGSDGDLTFGFEGSSRRRNDGVFEGAAAGSRRADCRASSRPDTVHLHHPGRPG